MKKTEKVISFVYEKVKNKDLAQLKTGQPVLGKGGALAQVIFRSSPRVRTLLNQKRPDIILNIKPF